MYNVTIKNMTIHDDSARRTTAMPDEPSFEDGIIADMRAHDGAVTAGPLKGHPLLIMTSTGARTSQPRRAILLLTLHLSEK